MVTPSLVVENLYKNIDPITRLVSFKPGHFASVQITMGNNILVTGGAGYM